MTRSNGTLTGSIEEFGKRHPSSYPVVEAVPGLEVTHAGTGRRCVVVSAAKGAVKVKLENGALVTLRLSHGAFRIDSRVVTLTIPRPTLVRRPVIGPSGSVTAEGSSPRVAAASRIWVEGIHDAELIEKIWGDDLRHVGIVVEPMHGADDLAASVADFGPRENRRLGILLDHLVEGSKETREAESARAALGADSGSVLIVGHPFIDVWEAVKPSVIGIEAWPAVPFGEQWKQGVCDRLGAGEPAQFWRRVLSSVTSYTDLDVALINSVERLIDFVTVP